MSITPQSTGRGVTLEDLAALNDEITALTRAGLPLDKGLGNFAHGSRGELGRLTQRLSEHLSQGRSLPEALLIEQHSVPPLYRAVVLAGIESQRLPDALESLADLVRTVGKLRREIGFALIYPMMVIVVAYVLVVGFFQFVIPQFVNAFADISHVTNQIIGLLAIAQQNMELWVGIPPVIFLLGMFWWTRTERSVLSSAAGTRGLPFFSPLRWIPGVNRVIVNSRRASFAELLALLIEHNVPLPKAFELAAATTGDRRLMASAEHLSQELENGHSLSDSIQRQAFPPFLAWMLQVGDRQGQLAPLIRRAAEYYRNRAASGSEWCRTMLPILLVGVIGGGVTMAYGWLLFYPLTQLLRNLNAG